MPQYDNPPRGMGLSAGACAVFAIADTPSKFLSARLPVLEIRWIRELLPGMAGHPGRILGVQPGRGQAAPPPWFERRLPR
jgi:hypothetical protein